MSILGFTYDETDSDADICDPGQMMSWSTGCDDCPAGQYSPGGGTQTCSDCPDGFTSIEGSAGSVGDCKFFLLSWSLRFQ